MLWGCKRGLGSRSSAWFGESDLLLVVTSPSFSTSPSDPSPSCWAAVVLMAPVLELTLPGPVGWPSTVGSPYALLRPDTGENTHINTHKLRLELFLY